MPSTGTVKWFNYVKGYGFIETEEGDIFVHATSVKGNPLKEGDSVTCEISEDDDGKKVCKDVEGGSGFSSKGKGKGKKGKGKGKGRKGGKGKGKGRKPKQAEGSSDAAATTEEAAPAEEAAPSTEE